MMAYFARVWLALDILLNVLLCGRVETMSSRMGRAIVERQNCRTCRFVCALLSCFWPDHCIHNIMQPVDKSESSVP